MRSIIDELAKASMITEAGDLNRLVEILDQLNTLSEAALSDGATDVADAASRTAALVDSIILRSASDPSEAIESMRRTIGELQAVVSSAGSSSDASSLPDSEFESDDSLLKEWIAACRDGLTELEADVLSISSGEGDRDELTQSARRRLHTIKGECGVLSLHEAQKVCHTAETLIDERPEFPVDAALAVIDWLRSYVDVLSENPASEAPDTSAIFGVMSGDGGASAADASVASEPVAEPSSPAAAPTIEDADGPVTFPPDVKLDAMLDDFACEAKEHIAASEGALLSLEDAPTDNELINTVFRAFHTIKGVAGFMNLEPIIRLAHIAETLLDRARNNQITLDSAYLDLILHSCDMMSQLIAVLVDDGQPPTRGVFEGLIHRLGEAVEGRLESSGPASDSSASKRSPSGGVEAAAAAPAPTEAAKTARRESDQTVKVSTERMDALVTMVGELVIAQQMVVQDDAVQSIDEQRTQRNLTHMGKIIRDLQEVSMSLRMVTLRGVFQRMARLVRDLSKKSGKQINFRIEGEDTELDRTVVEEIADPLVHMIRNACDHGLEPADERVAAGKDPTGTLTLRAYHSGGSIVIEISEDGRGLNRDRILSRAKERGLIPPEKDLAEISDQEAHNMIFLPGFSTAETITDISGRGVGMDVVRRNIEALRGKVEIRSKPGEGSTFLMRLPLTMAIIDGMVVRVGTQRYVIPTLSIERSFRPTTADLHSVVKRGEMVSIRGALLPVYRLKGIFGLSEGQDDITEALLIVLETNHSCCCLLVDEIIGQQQVVIKSLGQGLGRIRGVSGGAILGDGRVALIVDVEGLVAEATKAPGEARVKEGACG